MDATFRPARFSGSTCLAIACGIWLMCVSPNAVAQRPTVELNNPIAVTVIPENGHAFIIEQGRGRLLRWHGDTEADVDVVVEDLRSAPTSLDDVVAVTFRDGNRVTILGALEGQPRLATWSVDVAAPATFEEGLSGELNFDDGAVTTSMASTDLAIYIGTRRGNSGSLWRISAGRATLGKAERISTDEERWLSALTVSPQGHVVATFVDGEDNTSLRFHHALSGQALLTIPLDVRSVRTLAFSRSGLLYAACKQAETSGIYRLDTSLNEKSRQQIRSTKIVELRDVHSLACTNRESAVATSGGETGNVVRVKLP